MANAGAVNAALIGIPSKDFCLPDAMCLLNCAKDLATLWDSVMELAWAIAGSVISFRFSHCIFCNIFFFLISGLRMLWATRQSRAIRPLRCRKHLPPGLPTSRHGIRRMQWMELRMPIQDWINFKTLFNTCDFNLKGFSNKYTLKKSIYLSLRFKLTSSHSIFKSSSEKNRQKFRYTHQ